MTASLRAVISSSVHTVRKVRQDDRPTCQPTFPRWQGIGPSNSLSLAVLALCATATYAVNPLRLTTFLSVPEIVEIDCDQDASLPLVWLERAPSRFALELILTRSPAR
jgi:hypothetical protein